MAEYRQKDTRISEAGQTVEIVTLGLNYLAVQISGSWTGTLVFEGIIDPENWFSVNAYQQITGWTVTSTTENGSFLISVSGMNTFRVRASSITGEALVVLRSGVGEMKVDSIETANVEEVINWSDGIIVSFEKTVNGVTYVQTINYDVDGNVVGMSAWEAQP